MGESPQEKAAAKQNQLLGDFTTGFMGTGGEGYRARMAQMEPYFSKALGSIDTAKELAAQYTSANLGSLRGSTGAALAEGGVAKGSPISSAFLSSVAPAIGQMSGVQAQLEAGKASIFENEGSMLQRLMGMSDQSITQFLGLQNQSISQMKDTTGFGDVMGTLQTFATIGSALFGLPGIGSTLGNMFGFGVPETPGMPQLLPTPAAPATGYQQPGNVPFKQWGS